MRHPRLSPAEVRAQKFLHTLPSKKEPLGEGFTESFADRVEKACQQKPNYTGIVDGDGNPVSSLVDEPQHSAPKTPEGSSDITTISLEVQSAYDTLKALSSNFISPDEIQESLRGVSTAIKKAVTIPDECLAQMRQHCIAAANNPETPERIQSIKDHTEGETDPLIVIFPAYVMIDGKRVDFSLEMLSGLFPEQNGSYKPFFVSHQCKEVDKKATFANDVRVYTFAPLIGSKNKTYVDQLALQKQFYGDTGNIGVDMYLAVILHHWQNVTRTTVMFSDFMRLNTLGSDSVSMGVISGAPSVRLNSSVQDANSGSGIGASLSLL